MTTNNDDIYAVINEVKAELREIQSDINDILTLCTGMRTSWSAEVDKNKEAKGD